MQNKKLQGLHFLKKSGNKKTGFNPFYCSNLRKSRTRHIIHHKQNDRPNPQTIEKLGKMICSSALCTRNFHQRNPTKIDDNRWKKTAILRPNIDWPFLSLRMYRCHQKLNNVIPQSTANINRYKGGSFGLWDSIIPPCN